MYLAKLFSNVLIPKKIPGPKGIRSGDFPFLSSESFGKPVSAKVIPSVQAGLLTSPPF